MVRFLWVWGGNGLIFLVSAWAFWRGGRTERLGAAFIALAWIVTPFVQTHGIVGLDLGTTGVDLLLLIGLTWLSLSSRELWALLASASQLLCVIGHFASALSNNIGMFTYVTGNGFWGGYMLILALAIGMIGAERRRREEKIASTAAGHG
ncbi:MAG: hypothetical protein QM647_02410 [Asticcacaulis sp.]|uniref:hypothetical protein n=1 Tax=Asticcacaulis sp. TaxID=1872648 RepID=UPI0039E54792